MCPDKSFQTVIGPEESEQFFGQLWLSWMTIGRQGLGAVICISSAVG